MFRAASELEAARHHGRRKVLILNSTEKILKALICFLSLWLATPAFANSLEGVLCKTTPIPIAQMEGSEKLCRSFALALAEMPKAMSEEVRAMLTPESLAAMMALSATWMGAQGVPVVGQVVDAALVVLGIALLAAQAAELTDALWAYVNKAIEARSHAHHPTTSNRTTSATRSSSSGAVVRRYGRMAIAPPRPSCWR